MLRLYIFIFEKLNNSIDVVIAAICHIEANSYKGTIFIACCSILFIGIKLH